MPFSVGQMRAAFEGRYEVERELGRGAFATVFLARDVLHDRAVAIKILHPEIAQGTAVARFDREISIATRLSHPNILALFDSGNAAGLLYYVMPFATGESLRERLEREGALPIDDALRICREILDGLAHAHERNVLHRDIKPENILIESGRALLADFGVARALETDEIGITRTGLFVGTAGYMSPEQAAGGHVDARSDIYAVGWVLYEMLAGEEPLIGPAAHPTLGRIRAGEIRSVRSLRSAVSRELDANVRKALATNPADRFPSAAAFRAELDARRSGVRLPIRILLLVAGGIALALLPLYCS
jgi:serine/threonine protein kinase